jgi:ABC-type nickel/cobalt efflux system permease component RcnA
MVPDHWVPIALYARQHGWSKGETARAALMAGTGHVLFTLLIASAVWVAGVAAANRFGHFIDTTASIALIGFGVWIAVSAWGELRGKGGHGHSHGLGHDHVHGVTRLSGGKIHGSEPKRIPTDHGELELSIYEAGVPPRFRLTGVHADSVRIETLRENGMRQVFLLEDHGTHWESIEKIPEPHEFAVIITLEHDGVVRTFETLFTEDDYGRDLASALTASIWAKAPLHGHRRITSERTALLLILGSSPMVEAIPAFFAAGKYGIGLIIAMSISLAISTVTIYILLCVFSTIGLQRVQLGALERYGEVLSGAFIALIGVAFWVSSGIHSLPQRH